MSRERFCIVLAKGVGQMYVGWSEHQARECFAECAELARNGPGPIHGAVVTLSVNGRVEVFDPRAALPHEEPPPPAPELRYGTASDVRSWLEQRDLSPLTDDEVEDILYNLCNRVAELLEQRAASN